jgi:phosphatidylserine/phosphatidylglycerophosphate/cardiolipin synthase-like enzyme
MHAKLTVVDDTVLTGSYNLSHSGEENAENLLELRSPALADLCAAFVDRLVGRYSPAQPAGGQ